MKILALSGLIPEQICDVIRFQGYPERMDIAHYCSYASEFLAQALHDHEIDGAVFPRSCDSTRIMQSYFEGSHKFFFRLEVPVGQDETAIDFFTAELQRYKRAAENFFKIEFDDIHERIQLAEARNERLRELYERLDTLSYSAYLSMIHRNLRLPLREQTVSPLFETKGGRKRVFLVSSFLAEETVLKQIEDCGLRIVGDNLPESKRMIYSPKVRESSIKGIARSVLCGKKSPSRNRFQEIIKTDLQEIGEKHAKGVIFLVQKYCEPYEFFYSVYRKELAARGIPSVKIYLSGSEPCANAEFMLEAFSDMIG